MRITAKNIKRHGAQGYLVAYLGRGVIVQCKVHILLWCYILKARDLSYML